MGKYYQLSKQRKKIREKIENELGNYKAEEGLHQDPKIICNKRCGEGYI